MKYLVKFPLFEEVNPRDISKITTEFDDYFTVSFEFEIETDDKSSIKYDFSDFDDVVADDVISMICQELEIKKRSEKNVVNYLVYEVLEKIEDGSIDSEEFESIFLNLSCDQDRDEEIVKHTRAIIMSFVGSEDLEHLKKMVKLKLPIFYKRWWRKIEFVGDATLERGIEIKPKTYLHSISDGIGMLQDFFNELKTQDYWKLSQRTGLHINVGTKKQSFWNPIKGLLILNDFNATKEITPFVFKDMTWRMNNNFCGSLIPAIQGLSEEEKNQLKSYLNLHDIEETEVILNDFITDKILKWGIKNFGFNISKLQQNYVEFRYVGGVINVDIVIEKLKYFCFIVYCMTNQDYKRKEYLGKLYKFVNSL